MHVRHATADYMSRPADVSSGAHRECASGAMNGNPSCLCDHTYRSLTSRTKIEHNGDRGGASADLEMVVWRSAGEANVMRTRRRMEAYVFRARIRA